MHWESCDGCIYGESREGNGRVARVLGKVVKAMGQLRGKCESCEIRGERAVREVGELRK